MVSIKYFIVMIALLFAFEFDCFVAADGVSFERSVLKGRTHHAQARRVRPVQEGRTRHIQEARGRPVHVPIDIEEYKNYAL